MIDDGKISLEGTISLEEAKRRRQQQSSGARAECAARMAEQKMKPTVEVADARPPEFSDEALAQRFARVHDGTLRYIAAWSHWHAWTGARWELDSTLDAFDRARAICRAASSEDNSTHVKTRIAAAKTVAAVERLAKADRRIAATVKQWDADPDTFNTEAMPPGHDGGEMKGNRNGNQN